MAIVKRRQVTEILQPIYVAIERAFSSSSIIFYFKKKQSTLSGCEY